MCTVYLHEDVRSPISVLTGLDVGQLRWLPLIQGANLNVKSMMLTDAGSDEPMSVSFLQHYYFSITFNVILRSISGTGKVGSIVIFNILEHPKIVS